MTPAQRRVLGLGLGLGLGVVAMVGAVTVNQLLSSPGDRGWFAYAPNTSVVFEPSDDSATLRQALVWLCAVVAWAIPSFWLLRDRPRAGED
ncbi:MAG: hypothetical protein Q8K58_16045 [Acidimicrobiales bacterium]|nr:hypothetical protein [Acidimicrobiales bacterium]